MRMLAEWISEEEYKLYLSSRYQGRYLGIASFRTTKYRSTVKSRILDVGACRSCGDEASGLKYFFVLKYERHELCLLSIMCYECYLHMLVGL